MIWETPVEVPLLAIRTAETFKHARKSDVVPELAKDLQILGRPINLPVVRKHSAEDLELIAGQKRLAGAFRAEATTIIVQPVVCSDEEADFIRDAENGHRFHTKDKAEREAIEKVNEALVEKRKLILESQKGSPVTKTEVVKDIAKERGVKPRSVEQKLRRERRKKDSTGKPDSRHEAQPAAEKLGTTDAAASAGPDGAVGSEMPPTISQPAAPVGFHFETLGAEVKPEFVEYLGAVHTLLHRIAQHAHLSREGLRQLWALFGEDENVDPQLASLAGYSVFLEQLQETAMSMLPRSLCEECEGIDHDWVCNKCWGASWVP